MNVEMWKCENVKMCR